MNNIVKAGYVVEVVAFLANQATYIQMGFVSNSMVLRAFREAGIGRGSSELQQLMLRTGVIVPANNGDRYIDVEVARALVKALINGGLLPAFDRRTKQTRLRQLYERARRQREPSFQADAPEVGQTTTALPKARFSPEELAALRVLRTIARRYEDGFRVSLPADPSDLDPRTLCVAFVPAARYPLCAAGIEKLIERRMLSLLGTSSGHRIVYELVCDPAKIDVGPEFLSPPPRPRPVHKRRTRRPPMPEGRSPVTRRVRLASAPS